MLQHPTPQKHQQNIIEVGWGGVAIDTLELQPWLKVQTLGDQQIYDGLESLPLSSQAGHPFTSP